ncbi:MAG: nitrophenyl compound nitroreductase subunit ArsF family protein [Planctomycetota bacterium]|jgi:hypothetical protein
MRIKQVITACLLAFVITSIILIVKKEIKPPVKQTIEVKAKDAPVTEDSKKSTDKTPEQQFYAYYFHGNRRCDTCRAIENNTKETLNSHFSDELKSGALKFEIINVEKPENEHFITDYKLTTRSVVLSLKENGKESKFKNLVEVWSFADDKVTFIEYAKTEINEFMSSGVSTSE